MVFKAHFECARKGDDDQWNDGSCQDGVRNQEGNVNPSEPGRIPEISGADLKMISQVTDQKQDRAGDGGQHATPVGDDVLFADEQKRHREENGAQAVEKGV